MPTAIEELLRFDTPLSLFERWVLEPVEVDGRGSSRAAHEVAMLFGSANRDRHGLRAGRRARPRARARTRTCRSGPGSTTASARRSPSSSSGSPSRRCSAARRGSSSSRRRAGSRPSSCAASRRSASGSDRRCAYVALGDSYTIGTSVAAAERWPDQLVAALGPTSRGSSSSRTSASTATPRPTSSATSCPRSTACGPEFVERPHRRQRRRPGRPAGDLRGERRVILDTLARPVWRRPDRDRRDARTTRSRRPVPTTATRASRHDGIVAVNATHGRGSRASAGSPSWTRSTCRSGRPATGRSSPRDGLHPSGAQYALWVERIAPVVEGRIRG